METATAHKNSINSNPAIPPQKPISSSIKTTFKTTTLHKDVTQAEYLFLNRNFAKAWRLCASILKLKPRCFRKEEEKEEGRMLLEMKLSYPLGLYWHTTATATATANINTNNDDDHHKNGSKECNVKDEKVKWYIQINPPSKPKEEEEEENGIEFLFHRAAAVLIQCVYELYCIRQTKKKKRQEDQHESNNKINELDDKEKERLGRHVHPFLLAYGGTRKEKEDIEKNRDCKTIHDNNNDEDDDNSDDPLVILPLELAIIWIQFCHTVQCYNVSTLVSLEILSDIVQKRNSFFSQQQQSDDDDDDDYHNQSNENENDDCINITILDACQDLINLLLVRTLPYIQQNTKDVLQLVECILQQSEKIIFVRPENNQGISLCSSSLKVEELKDRNICLSNHSTQESIDVIVSRLECMVKKCSAAHLQQNEDNDNEHIFYSVVRECLETCMQDILHNFHESSSIMTNQSDDDNDDERNIFSNVATESTSVDNERGSNNENNNKTTPLSTSTSDALSSYSSNWFQYLKQHHSVQSLTRYWLSKNNGRKRSSMMITLAMLVCVIKIYHRQKRGGEKKKNEKNGHMRGEVTQSSKKGKKDRSGILMWLLKIMMEPFREIGEAAMLIQSSSSPSSPLSLQSQSD